MDHIIHLPEFRVVVCKECKYAVLPSEIDSHFQRQRPHKFTKEARQKITTAVEQIHGLIQRQEEIAREFQFPIDTAKPITVLAAPRTNGFRCTFTIEGGKTCPWVSANRKRIGEHSWEEHHWKSTNKGGWSQKKSSTRVVQEVPWRIRVQYQRFFMHGPKSGFFEVGRNTEPSTPMPKSTLELLQEQTNKEIRRIEEIKQRMIEAMDESK